MSAEQRFADFSAAWERGERPDPAAAIAAAPDADRDLLATMITVYLADRPRTDVTEAEVAARAADPRSAPPQSWDLLLPELRARSGTTRGALVSQLARALGHPEARAQVEEHVHGLETGQLAPRRVRPPVVAALARILGVPESLLELGRRIAPAASAADPALAFHRPGGAASGAPADAAPAAGEPARVAAIDDLFTGADG
jgi:hypothetical protein